MKNTLHHLAIIMDGNGRWAESKGLKRNKGHEEGAKTLRTITEYVAKKKISFLTLYAFSTENWKRPKKEIDFLMKLLIKFLKKETPSLVQNNIKFETIGDLNIFSENLIKQINDTKEKTKNNTGLTQCLAINYGSKNEITRAIKKLIKNKKDINEINLQNSLDTKEMPDVDLLIRTGGEKRLSNFLLWQSAYAELYFSDTLWPDFNTIELEHILNNFQNAHRRFGGL